MIWLKLADKPASIMEQLQGRIIQRFGSYEPFARYDVGSLNVGKTLVYDVQAKLSTPAQKLHGMLPLWPDASRILPVAASIPFRLRRLPARARPPRLPLCRGITP